MSDADGTGRRGDLLGGAAVILAVLLVVGSIQMGLSITLRALALLTVFVTTFGLAVGTGREESLTYPALITLLAFVLYGMVAFEPSRVLAPVLVLVALVALLVLLYVLSERLLSPTPWAASVGAPAAVLVVVAIAIVDLQTGGVVYELELADEVTVETEGVTNASGDLPLVAVGTATAETTAPFREPASFPDAQACVYTEEGRTDRSVAFESGGSIYHSSVPALGTLSADATLLLSANETRALEDRSVPVERADSCPDDAAAPRIVIVPGNGWSTQ